eukprot:Gb_22153 [translate_table: standard]
MHRNSLNGGHFPFRKNENNVDRNKQILRSVTSPASKFFPLVFVSKATPILIPAAAIFTVFCLYSFWTSDATLLVPDIMASGRGSSNVEKLVDLHLLKLHHEIHTCLKENGDGLQVSRLDKCKLRIKYPNGTPNTWDFHQQFVLSNIVFQVYRKKSSRIELREPFNLTWDYDICDMLIYWTQAKKRAAVMTKDTIDCYLSTGRQEQIVRHLLHPGECQNEQACMEDIRNVLPSVPPLMPGQAKDCALVGNAGNLKTELSFAKEIDNHSTIIRLNDAVINDKYFKWTGNRTSYRFINERVARALDYFISRQYIRNVVTRIFATSVEATFNLVVETCLGKFAFSHLSP